MKWLLATNYAEMDWFNDSHWTTIQANMHLLGKAVKAGKLKGIFFDPEDYSGASNDLDPWLYTKQSYPGKTFAQVEAQVRQRTPQGISRGSPRRRKLEREVCRRQ